MDKKQKAILALSAVVFVAAVAVMVWAIHGLNQKPITSRNGADVTEEETWGYNIEQNNVKYEYNTDISSILFLGIDDAENNNGRSDTIMLLILDKSAKTIKILSISRDTMIDVDTYDIYGEYAYTAPTHLNMQYSFGDSPRKSCFLTKRTISSRLIRGIRIEGCIALTADGLNRLVDDIGGLSITLPSDYTDIDEAYTEGATVKLNGAEAERLFRYRDTTELGSSEERLNRQLDLSEELFKNLTDKLDSDSITDITDKLGNAFYTDLDADTLDNLAHYTLEEKTYTLPGEVKAGEDHDEFYVDEQELDKLLLDLFYTKK